MNMITGATDHFFDRLEERGRYGVESPVEAIAMWKAARPILSEPINVDGRARWYADAGVILVARDTSLVTCLEPSQAVDRLAEGNA